MKTNPLPYLPNMFASCMVVMVVYSLCVLLWVFFPDMAGHAILLAIFPGFKLLNFANFIYGMLLSSVYGWFISATYVFFYNLWPRWIRLISGN